jgi:hypothetical protein
VPFLYNATATDPDGGYPLTYDLPVHPAGMAYGLPFFFPSLFPFFFPFLLADRSLGLIRSAILELSRAQFSATYRDQFRQSSRWPGSKFSLHLFPLSNQFRSVQNVQYSGPNSPLLVPPRLPPTYEDHVVEDVIRDAHAAILGLDAVNLEPCFHYLMLVNAAIGRLPSGLTARFATWPLGRGKAQLFGNTDGE